MPKEVTFTMPVTSEEYEKAIPNIPSKFREKFETYRQLAIVREIMKTEGSSFYEKALTCMYEWPKENSRNSIINYKIRHK